MSEKGGARVLARLRERSVGAIDPQANALAIAAGDERVAEALSTRLAAGATLKGVHAVATGAPNQVEAVFEVEPGDAGGDPLQSFSAVVDLTRGEVVTFNDMYVGGGGPSAPQGALPFALAVPSQSSRVATSSEALAPFVEREQNFLEEQGLAAQARAGGYDTKTKCWGMTQIDTKGHCIEKQEGPLGTIIAVWVADSHPDERGESITDYTNDIGPPQQ